MDLPLFLYVILNVPLISWMRQKFTHALVFVDRKRNIVTSLSFRIHITWEHVCRKLPSRTRIGYRSKMMYHKETLLNNKYKQDEIEKELAGFYFLKFLCFCIVLPLKHTWKDVLVLEIRKEKRSKLYKYIQDSFWRKRNRIKEREQKRQRKKEGRENKEGYTGKNRNVRI
jgi:hypothetical protein